MTTNVTRSDANADPNSSEKAESFANRHNRRRAKSVLFRMPEFKGLKRTLKSILKAAHLPYLFVNTISVFMVLSGVIYMLGVAGTAALFASVVSGDQISMNLALSTAIALLTGSLSMSFLGERERSKSMDEATTKQLALLTDTIDVMRETIRRQAIAIEGLETILSNVHDTWTPNGVNCLNDIRAWDGLQFGTELTTVNSYGLHDVIEDQNSAGELTYRINTKRVMIWLARFIGANKLSVVQHVFPHSPTRLASENFRPSKSLLRVLAAYKGLAKIAEMNGMSSMLDLTKARVWITPSTDEFPRAYFICTKRAETDRGSPIQSVYKYDHPVTNGLMPNDVICKHMTRYCGPVEVAAFTQSARVLINGAPRGFNVAELINMYDDELKIALDADDTTLTAADRLALGLPAESTKQKPKEWGVDHGGASFVVYRDND